jgi:hypothetical protein
MTRGGPEPLETGIRQSLSFVLVVLVCPRSRRTRRLVSLLPRHGDHDGLLGRDQMVHVLSGAGNGNLHSLDAP